MSSFSPPEGSLPAEAFDLPVKFMTTWGKSTLWVVAVDGSDLSMRALRLTCFLMDKNDKINVVRIVKEGTDPEEISLFGKCTEEVRSCGVLPDEKILAGKVITAPAGWEVGDVLTYYTNHIRAGGGTCLVLGAQGSDHKAGASAEARTAKLGHIATQCLAKVKVPVLTVAGPWKAAHGDLGPLGRKQRTGKNGKPGLTFMCCVDGTTTGKVAFDMATRMCQKGDTLLAVHICLDADVASKTSKQYKDECSKVELNKGLAECKYVAHHMGPRQSLDDAIADVSQDADVLVMGTIELVEVKKRHMLGSVAMAIAKASAAHLCMVKNYATL